MDYRDFAGEWELVRDKSSDIGRFSGLIMEINASESEYSITRNWGRGTFTAREAHSFPVKNNTLESARSIIDNRAFPANVFMGIFLPVGSERNLTPQYNHSDGELRVKEVFSVRSSQGKSEITAQHLYRLDEDGEILVHEVERSTRKKKLTYTYKRKGSRAAYVMELDKDWELTGGLPEKACLLSIQGLVNTGSPLLYFVYPSNWDFRFTPGVYDFLRDKRMYSFKKLAGIEAALSVFRDHIEGYVVWDQAVRSSLITAFTAAGIFRSIVIPEELIPMMERNGIPCTEDLRSIFRGKTDAEIYRWAYERYWNKCSKNSILWMGGEAGNVMKPGVADWGIRHKMFFNDLSTNPASGEEYELARKLFSEMDERSLIFGWHSYKKDTEEQHVTLASSFSHRVEGLHSLPNLSFSSHIPPTPGFVFKNNHNVEPGKKYPAENKVYLSCIQTDCLGIGAWTEPGRGKIPYAWEVTMNWYWLAPAMMEFFYTQATPNDFFIGSLSGPGYMYPKAIPEKDLPGIIQTARELMDKLDLNVFEIMDYSEGFFHMGNADLPKEIVDAYYRGMPDAVGFVNGYGPAYTFTVRNGVPFISYDYYLQPTQTEEDAALDLEELADINTDRPYFLLMHVRNFSDIERVIRIVEKLSPRFEVLPLDVFIKMAGESPTFKERYLDADFT
ncbi:MAG: GxGYxYP domain-containing protein [Spirochaetia bacterium]